jgi:hypothetical protein
LKIFSYIDGARDIVDDWRLDYNEPRCFLRQVILGSIGANRFAKLKIHIGEATVKLKRDGGNPILCPNPANDWKDLAVFNPAAWYDEDNKQVLLLYRAAVLEGFYRTVPPGDIGDLFTGNFYRRIRSFVRTRTSHAMPSMSGLGSSGMSRSYGSRWPSWPSLRSS